MSNPHECPSCWYCGRWPRLKPAEQPPEVPAPEEVWVLVTANGNFYEECCSSKEAAEELSQSYVYRGYDPSTPVRYVRAR